jgi:PhnB protein
MTIAFHLAFDGQCEAAFAAYARILHGTVVYSLRWGDSAAASQAPPDWQGKLYHATLRVGVVTLMGGDVLPQEYRAPQGYSLNINLADRDEAHRIFGALADGGTVRMPVQETFWSPAFGVVVDRFGIMWVINCDQATELVAMPSA